MNSDISAIILAAGKSTRMGQPKMLLPWGDTTVLGQVISVVGTGLAGRDFEIIVVTGSNREKIEADVVRAGEKRPVRCVFNPDFENGEMLSSLQVGLAACHPSARGVLIGLGDQPQIREGIVRSILGVFDPAWEQVIIPSFEKRRGHPILINMIFKDELLALKTPQTLRDFLNKHASQIIYIEGDGSILQDLDTPEDYARFKMV